MNKVAILCKQNASLFELGCATEFFALARPEVPNWYQGEVISFEHQKVNTVAGVSMDIRLIRSLDEFDTLVIPSWYPEQTLDKDVIDRVQSFYHKGGRILSFCTGAFFVAECGLLTDREATTHWAYADTFKTLYPDVTFVEDVLYVYKDNIGCSAGSAAAIDFSLAVIREDFGHTIANQVARRLVVSPHRDGGQAQFVETPILSHQVLFAKTLDWAKAHLDTQINVDSLAQQAAMSRRSFDRHFRASMGVSAKTWLTQQRLNLAKRLLEEDKLNMEQVAIQSGFNNPMTLRHCFRQYLTISPSQYRRQFALRKTN
ncbi:transcriptional regulator [Marinomonas sp. SBI22]|uniref:helix-turn-helix domain-containing protein n=1 Tax=unclassified Marinomonas TaxID=196814 RepID=UPI0007AF70DE|nr:MULTISPECIES: helix-turn-helix domain-containing protein [unclassified Marinomonas]KZM38764.1 transcriptional regulator [Marinomonas sp. SBI8L]KZM43772.1 transcriptional regulator [Marinomonas sp. SBI22]